MVSESDEQRGSCTQFKWWAGIGILFIASLMQLASLTYLDLVLVSAVNGMQLLASVILSVFWLKETFYWKWDFPAIVLIILGCAGMVVFTDKTVEEQTFEELKSLLYSFRSVAYVSFQMLFFGLSGLSYYLLMWSLIVFESHLEAQATQIRATRELESLEAGINSEPSTGETWEEIEVQIP